MIESIEERPSEGCVILQLNDGSGAINVTKGAESSIAEEMQQLEACKNKYVRV